MEKRVMTTLWRRDPVTPEGKYLVKRRDGTVPKWPHFVLGARDPSSPIALRAYAAHAESIGMNKSMCDDIRRLADEFEVYRAEHGSGDPDRGPHRVDDPITIAEMRKGMSA